MSRKASVESSLQKFLHPCPQKVSSMHSQGDSVKTKGAMTCQFWSAQVLSDISLTFHQRGPVSRPSVHLLSTQLQSQNGSGFTRFIPNGGSQFCQSVVRREDCIRALQSPHSTSNAEAQPLKKERPCTLTCLLSMYPGRSALKVSWMLTSLNEKFLGGRNYILCFPVCTKGRPLGFTKHLDGHLRH